MIITIITATYNVEASLPTALASLADQAYPAESIQHLIVDGASTDRTVEVAKELAPHAEIVSEPDRGIYDALNKGIALATGEIIGILHATDIFADRLVLDRVSNAFKDPDVMCCYGDLEYVREVAADTDGQFSAVRYWKAGPYTRRSFYWGWMPPHPTFFCRRECFEKFGGYRLDLGTAADYELMLRLLLKYQQRAEYIPEVLVRMRVGGASNASFRARCSANAMDRQAWRLNGLSPWPWTTLVKPLRKLPQWWQRASKNHDNKIYSV